MLIFFFSRNCFQVNLFNVLICLTTQRDSLCKRRHLWDIFRMSLGSVCPVHLVVFSLSIGDVSATPVTRLGSEQAPSQPQFPLESAWRSWSVGTQWGKGPPEAEPPLSFCGGPPQGSRGPAEEPRSYWEASGVSALACLQCCIREDPASCWPLRVAGGRRGSRSLCRTPTWGSTGTGSRADEDLVSEGWWLWRTMCRF